MGSSTNLPRRRSSGYYVTDITFEIIAREAIAAQIIRTVPLEPLPEDNINELQLAELLRRLTRHAVRATRLLEYHETADEARTYLEPSYERVQIKVLSGGRLIGRVNGAQQTFDPRGKMTSPGILAHPDPRHQGKKEGS